MTRKEFMEKVADYAVEHYEQHKILPSMTIAQAIIESSWGTSELGVKAHNYFGMKWNPKCGCDYYEKKTGEQRKDGEYYTVVAKFRKYPTMKDGLKGYYDFIESKPRYNNLKGVTDYKEACMLIKTDGWATSLTYTQTLIKTINIYDLTRYDSMVLDTNATVTADCKFYKGMNEWEGYYRKVTPSQKVKIVKDVSNGWSRVSFNNHTGYIKNTCLKLDDGTELSKYPTRHTIKTVALRSDRKVAKSTKVGSLEPNTDFILRGKDSKWAYIKYQNEFYYVYKSKTNVK